jgi:hypothetical protein
LKANDARVIALVLNLSLADIFALYLKTKSYHWHISGAQFWIFISCGAITSSSILAKSTGMVTSLRRNNLNYSARDTSSIQITALIDAR